MKLNKRHQRGGLEMNMTPMIDVTFLLLIFFMTVHAVSKANRENIPLPKTHGSQDQTETPLTINVRFDGGIVVSGNRLSLAQLASVVGEELGKHQGEPSQLKVVLRADRGGTSRTVNEVVTLLERLDVRAVRIAVEG
jgi:biopolymer transport protein ExbD